MVTKIDQPLRAGVLIVDGGQLRPRAFKKQDCEERFDVERVLSSFTVGNDGSHNWRFACQMTSGDLLRILKASEEAGLKRFLYHNHVHLTAAGWSVISRLCGTPWVEDPNGYWPPDTPKPRI